MPKAGGVRPQLLVTIDLDSLLGRPGAWGRWGGPALASEACRRLACDATVIRVLVRRQPTHRSGGDTMGPRPPALAGPLPTRSPTTATSGQD